MNLGKIDSGPIRVLILDSDRDHCILTSDMLEQIDGRRFATEWLTTAAQAEARLDDVDWDLMIIGHRPPATDGLAFIRSARERGCVRPLVLLAAAEGASIDSRALEAGASDFLVNDELTANALSRSIRYAVERSRQTQQLKENERHLNMALQSSRAAVWEIDIPSGRISHDDGFHRLLGRERQSIPDALQGFGSLTHPDDWPAVLQTIEEHLSGRTAEAAGEYRVRSGSGEWVWCYARGRVVERDADGKPARLMGVALDINERKQAEEALRRSEERYRAIFETIQDVYYETSLDGIITEISPSIQRISKYTREELLGKAVASIYRCPEDRDLLLIEIMKSGRVNDYGLALVDKDGSIHHCSASAELIRDAGGNPSGIIGSLRDVTEGRRAQDELERSRERYENLYNNAQVGLFRTRISDGKILACNELAAELFGYDDTAQMMREYTTSEHYVDRNERDKMLHELHIRGSVHNWESEFTRKDGTTFWARHSSRIFTDLGIIEGAVSDCTDQVRAEQALRESEEKYRLLTENLKDVVLRISLTGRLEYCSPAVREFGGYDPAEEKGKRISRYFARKRDYLKAIRMIRRAAMHRRGSSMEFLYKARNREPFWVEVSGQPVISNGKVLAIQGVMRDISERRRSEESIRQSEARFRKMADLLPEGVYEATLDGRLSFANRLAHEWYGYPADAVSKGLNISDLLVPGDRERAVANIARILSGEELGAVEYTGLRKDGSTFPVAIHSSRIVRNGRPVGLRGVIVDITERRRKEEELRRLSKAVNQSGNLICITDSGGVIEYVNAAFTEATGYRAEEVMGSTFDEIRSGEHDESYYREMWRIIGAGRTYSGVFRNRRRNGELYWERKTISPIHNDNGEITHYLSVGADVTSEITAQQKLAEADKLSAIGMLAAGVAHEFKNYLGGIIGNASLALDRFDDDDGLSNARDTLTQIVDMGEKANEVAMSLLTYSKARPEDFTRVELHKLVKNAVSLIDKELSNLDIEVVSYFEDTPAIYGSPSKLQQMLLNLLINAQHAIGGGGVISVSIFNAGATVEVKIGDTGKGIPEENIKRIFNPFFSTKGAWGRDEVVGTGMGLSICQNVAREHGGEIAVVSTHGVGTTFTVSLPVPEQDLRDQPGPSSDTQPSSMLIFTLDKSLVSHYHLAAAEKRIDLLAVDALDHVVENLSGLADVVVCDARFSGKIELLRVAEACRETGVCYVMINCGATEYQLADVFDNSAGNFAGLPEIEQITQAVAKADDQHKPPGSSHRTSTTG